MEEGATMSDGRIARRAQARISFDGANITDDIMPYLLSISYTDNEEDASDDLQIQLQDRENIWLTDWIAKMVAAERTVESEVTVKSTVEVATAGTMNVGDTVQFLGGPHYVASTAPSPNGNPSAGPAKLTIIKSGAPHPYHVIHTDGTSRVYGWVNTSQVAPIGGGTQTVETTRTSKTVTSTGLKIRAVFEALNWNGGGSDATLDCGEFELDSVKVSAPPYTATIKATSLPYTSKIRQTKQSKGWESYNLSGIANEMAGLNGMSCSYLASNDPFYSRVEQYRCSDIDFLSKLCHDAGLSLKSTDNKLVIFDQLEYEGRPSILDVRNGDGSYIKFSVETGQANVQYASCRVSYVLPNGSCIEGIAYVADYNEENNSNQQLEIYAPVASASEAKALAAKNLRLHNKFERQISFTFPGNVDLVAGATMNLSGFGLWNGKYIIKQAKHTISSSGYTVQVKGRRVLGGY